MLDVPTAKVARYETDFTHCIICQEQTEELLVEKPTAYGKVLEFIAERAKYGDGNYPDISRRIRNLTAEDLTSRKASWHRKCYQDTVHTSMCKRAKERYEKTLASRDRPGRRESTESHSSDAGTFTRSQSSPYDKDLCFFCERGALYNNPLHNITTENAGRTLKRAVEKSSNEKLSVKLCTAISLEDAHAIDIKYHKRCWATNVTHVLCKGSDQPAP